MKCSNLVKSWDLRSKLDKRAFSFKLFAHTPLGVCNKAKLGYRVFSKAKIQNCKKLFL